MLDVTVHNDRIHIGERFSVSFQRTLRIPDDGKVYPLPPGLGAFPIHSAAEYWVRVPPTWLTQNDYFIPMYQREALWLGFDGANWQPNAVKIAITKRSISLNLKSKSCIIHPAIIEQQLRSGFRLLGLH